MKTYLLAIGLLLGLNSYADIDTRISDKEVRVVSSTLTPSQVIERDARQGEGKVQYFLLKNGTKTPLNLPQFSYQKSCNAQGNFHLNLEAKDEKFVIKSRKVYEIIFNGSCSKSYDLIFENESEVGELAIIWDIMREASRKFKELGIQESWNRKITVKWPSNGDYYQWGTVNITKGYQWDVVGHELGHAIYDMGNIGVFGGGAHRIDECYSHALALSEGWASFFAAWLKVNLQDEDAKFEYMVKRRAPIQFENIPSDVCEGEKNEWRVTGFLWDIIDYHDDQEQMNVTFKKMWEVTKGQNFKTTKKLAQHLIKNFVDRFDIEAVWLLNFMKPF
tara:strand:+ start:61424 stop:62422 length:999 start_codon:yes stop_codon:yes gene_type:complete